jgi:hypothetical protein
VIARAAALGPRQRWGTGAGLIIGLFVVAWLMQPVETPASAVDVVELGGLLLMFGAPVGAAVAFFCARRPGQPESNGLGRFIAVVVLAIYTWGLAWILSFSAGDLMCGDGVAGGPCGTTAASRLSGIAGALVLWSLYAALESFLSRRSDQQMRARTDTDLRPS